MDEEVWENVKVIMEKIKPFIALIVLILIIFSSYNLYKYRKVYEEAKESCGYQYDEKIFCICDKDYVSSTYSPGNPYYSGGEPTQGLNLSVDSGD